MVVLRLGALILLLSFLFSLGLYALTKQPKYLSATRWILKLALAVGLGTMVIFLLERLVLVV